MASTFESTVQTDRAIRGLNWAFVLIGVAEATLLPFMPLYLFERGLGAAAIGVVLAAAALAAFVAGPGWAYVADHGLGRERTLVVASCAAAVVALFLVVPGGTFAIAGATVALWTVRSPFMSLLDAIALQSLERSSAAGLVAMIAVPAASRRHADKLSNRPAAGR